MQKICKVHEKFAKMMQMDCRIRIKDIKTWKKKSFNGFKRMQSRRVEVSTLIVSVV